MLVSNFRLCDLAPGINTPLESIVEVFYDREWIVEHTLQPVRVRMELCTEVFDINFLPSIEQRKWGISFRRVDGKV